MTRVELFDPFAIARAVFATEDWKTALDNLVGHVRAGFIFDNLAIYLSADKQHFTEEVVYARAVGRGKTAEADAAWGEAIAARVVQTGKNQSEVPVESTRSKDRMKHAYLLGLPLRARKKILGALVFIRFGGPEFNDEHISQAEFVALQVGALVERRALLNQISQLDDARRQLQLQEDFIATISHELRTPLGFVKGYTTTLLRPDTTWDAPTQREFLSIIDEEADYLQSLIENMLESARLQSATLQMNFQPLRLESLLRDITARFSARYPELKIETDYGACPLIQGDNIRLGQVIENLYSNAVKYAPEAPLKISLSSNANEALIDFQDRGPGIPSEHIPHIFERFYRVPSQLSRQGTGLGLYICRQIVQAHHGEITVESVLNQGTTFHIRIPHKQSAD